MVGHNIGFKGLIWKIIPKFSLLPLLIWNIELQVKGDIEDTSNSKMNGNYL